MTKKSEQKIPNFNKFKKIIISIMGPHAGDSSESIFQLKKNQIDKYKKAYWLCKSYGCNVKIFKKWINESLVDKKKNNKGHKLRSATKKVQKLLLNQNITNLILMMKKSLNLKKEPNLQDH